MRAQATFLRGQVMEQTHTYLYSIFAITTKFIEIYDDYLTCSKSYDAGFTETSGWDFNVFLQSALISFLKDQIETNQSIYGPCTFFFFLSPYDWQFLFEIALNPLLSKKTLLFLQELDLFSICNKEKQKEVKILLLQNEFLYTFLEESIGLEKRIEVENLLFLFFFDKIS